MTGSGLGEFLRARRAQRTPQDAGLLYSGQRKVSGLRREEVAVLAGVNVDYYTRLEQGRERNPSPQVLDALARALDLGPAAREHLYRLAGSTPPAESAIEPGVGVELRQLIDGYLATPVFVINRMLDVLATNALADALFAPLRPAGNLAEMVFLHPAARRFYPQWDRAAQATVANLRSASGFAQHDPRFESLIEALSEGSPAFRELWGTHQVRGKTHEAKDFLHPDVGALTLTYQAFDVRGAAGQQLVIYHAEPGSRSAEALGMLRALRVVEPESISAPHSSGVPMAAGDLETRLRFA
ncbi:helix-turn-helix transcriptional regulator [Actinoalloteichus hymeniacidonis]|uniref:DNA binding protein with helix-turn-helix domain n=1 Tax=Actinoalloteichus hymeniacidonis TaxID=340345 RepID=A0AAC9HQ33_9PSEU|nr:helix-turn-helix transcriptional regulator [Actinoalloteichus hymeniacidonis]AOS63264.1 DNA binding protein with helix-turn-helix domain [Actinoalloteichus hymeniacidonis]MBB5908697.1 transcriptional regulator with XRE-family HTH domain [Actinoalloteichus hymeniacidonis]